MLVCLASLHVSAVFAAGTPPEPPVTLDWRAPGECPGEHDVAATLASLRRRRPAQAESEALDVRAVVRKLAPQTWTLRLTLRTSRGRQLRALQATECRLLARATALLVAIRLDPAIVGKRPGADDDLPAEFPALVEPAEPASSRRTEGSPGPPVVREPPGPSRDARLDRGPGTGAAGSPGPSFLDDVIDVPAPAARGEASPARTRAELRGHLRLEGGLDYGVLPGLGGDVGAFGGLSIRGVRIELGVVGVPARTRSAAGVSGRFDRLAVGLRICPGWRVPRGRNAVTLFGCLGVEAGAIRAEETAGIARPNVHWAPWSGLLFGAGARWAVTGPLGLSLAVEGVAATTRPVFTAGADDDLVFRAGPAGVRVNLGMELQFPSRDR